MTMYREITSDARNLRDVLNEASTFRVTISNEEAEIYAEALRVADLLGGDWPHIEGASPELIEAAEQWRVRREI